MGKWRREGMELGGSEVSRRRVLGLGSAAAFSMLGAPALAQAFSGEIDEEADLADAGPAERARRNTQSFRNVRWQDHFDHLRNGAILCDTASRALHFWSEDEEIYLLYPCSVPMSEEFTRRGRTEITLMRRAPVWIPTPNMRERDPELPARVEPGPDNPMGTRAMNLTWQYYRIHGIDNPAKIGRKASNGCFGLHNENVERLFELAGVGTQVVVI
ncbi:L,D-transpeptidase [Alkalilacustris brevis]|uniref:L,D-transpeptidase n=1 Tax=Alkalilacustris brevis TaxID=2026338 RepID=UPI001EE3BA0E|nr:L,D-transpeptidase [Alkalilacustris brevis]